MTKGGRRAKMIDIVERIWIQSARLLFSFFFFFFSSNTAEQSRTNEIGNGLIALWIQSAWNWRSSVLIRGQRFALRNTRNYRKAVFMLQLKVRGTTASPYLLLTDDALCTRKCDCSSMEWMKKINTFVVWAERTLWNLINSGLYDSRVLELLTRWIPRWVSYSAIRNLRNIFCQISRKLSKIQFLCKLMKLVNFLWRFYDDILNDDFNGIYHFGEKPFV